MDPLGCLQQSKCFISRVLRDSTPRFVGPSVGPSVGPLRLCKNSISWLFLVTVRSYTETNDQPTSFESLFTHLFVHLSLHTNVT